MHCDGRGGGEVSAYGGVEKDGSVGSFEKLVKDEPVPAFDLGCACGSEGAHTFERVYLVRVLWRISRKKLRKIPINCVAPHCETRKHRN